MHIMALITDMTDTKNPVMDNVIVELQRRLSKSNKDNFLNSKKYGNVTVMTFSQYECEFDFIKYELMSITKAAIGLCYMESGVSFELPLVPDSETVLYPLSSRVSIGQALHHQTGVINDQGSSPEEEFDYEEYRKRIQGSGKDGALQYCLQHFERRLSEVNPEVKPVFAYNNVVWHVLAWRYQTILNESITDAFDRLMQSAGVSRSSWSWEQDAEGFALGPHGLSMTNSGAIAMGRYMQRVLVRKPDLRNEAVKASDDFWDFLELPGPLHVYAGWWFCKDVMFAHGYNHQFIVLTVEGVYSQLRGPEYWQDPSGEEQVFLSQLAAD